MEKTTRAIVVFAALAILAGGAAWAEGAAAGVGADNVDELFNSAPDIQPAEANIIENPESAALESKGLVWGGELTADAKVTLPYGSLPPRSFEEWTEVDDSLAFDLGAKLSFDSRPDRNYRVYGSFIANYPFTTGIKSLADPTAAYNPLTNPVTKYSLAQIQVFELFADFNWKERLFLRFGKQTMGWGLSRFYQVADPLSLGVKDPQDPTKELEGPVGLKLSLPIGPHGLYAYVVSKDSFTDGVAKAGLEDLGYGLKGDYFLSVPKNPVLSDAELSAGYYYQKRLAPKAVFGLSMGVLGVQLFSDQVLSFGGDGYRLDSGIDPALSAMSPAPVRAMSKDGSTLFYSATAGAMYIDTEAHLTLYGEYFFNGQGSRDPDYTKNLGERYYAEQNPFYSGTARVAQSDLFAYNGMHNTGFSASLSELFGTDKLSCSLFWQANWIDLSGMVVPSISFAPWKRFSLTLGSTFAYGPADSEFILKTADYGSGMPSIVRLAPYLKIYFGAGKF
jgi:hypothetical protein